MLIRAFLGSSDLMYVLPFAQCVLMSLLEVSAVLLFAVPLVRAPDQPVEAFTSDLLSAAVVSLVGRVDRLDGGDNWSSSPLLNTTLQEIRFE